MRQRTHRHAHIYKGAYTNVRVRDNTHRHRDLNAQSHIYVFKPFLSIIIKPMLDNSMRRENWNNNHNLDVFLTHNFSLYVSLKGNLPLCKFI